MAVMLYGYNINMCEVMMFLNDLFPEGGVMLALLQVYPQQILGRTPVSHLDFISVISIYQWSTRSLAIGGVQSLIYSSYIYMHAPKLEFDYLLKFCSEYIYEQENSASCSYKQNIQKLKSDLIHKLRN